MGEDGEDGSAAAPSLFLSGFVHYPAFNMILSWMADPDLRFTLLQGILSKEPAGRVCNKSVA